MLENLCEEENWKKNTGEKVGETFQKPGLGKKFSDMTPKARPVKTEKDWTSDGRDVTN